MKRARPTRIPARGSRGIGGVALALTVALARVEAGCALDPLSLPEDAAGGGAACDGGCADDNPCTIDRCQDGACTWEPAPPGVGCDDGDRCNGLSRCNGLGQCSPGTPKVIDDGDPCTTDACDPANGAVTHVPIPGCAR